MGQDDHSQSIGDGSGLPSRLVEALLLLGQGNFYYRFRARFHPIATIQSPLFKLRRRKNRAYDPAIPRQ
jgi:hypothetical protein